MGRFLIHVLAAAAVSCQRVAVTHPWRKGAGIKPWRDGNYSGPFTQIATTELDVADLSDGCAGLGERNVTVYLGTSYTPPPAPRADSAQTTSFRFAREGPHLEISPSWCSSTWTHPGGGARTSTKNGCLDR